MAVLVASAVIWVVLDDAPYDADLPGSSNGNAPGPLPALAAETLDALQDALDTGDTAAASELAPPGDDRAARLLGDVASGAGSLGLSVDLRYVDETGSVAADGTWSAAVETRWRYADDTGSVPARAEVTVSFRPDGPDHVAILGFGDPDSGRLPIWLSGPLAVATARGITVAVAGHGALSRSEAARYLRLSTEAVGVVHRVLPSWHGRLVVEVPASSAALDRAMDASPGTSSGIAAVTAPVDGSPDTDSPVHVFVNPEVFDELQPTGAQVVLSHEVVHLATGAARSNAVPWLVEGFADYVALRDVDLPVTTSAAQIISQVRRDGVPSVLPGDAEFATGSGHLGATYESAWLACVLLADRAGEPALVALYTDVLRGTPLAEALGRHFALTESDLTRLWQRRLRDLAG